jgi:hypothetical protein
VAARMTDDTAAARMGAAPSVLASRVHRIAQSQSGRRRLVVPYGVCVRCAGYQVLHASGLCWDCAPPARWAAKRLYLEPARSVVYYAACGGLIKIGTTDRLYGRMHQLKARLLGFEPGSYDLETARKRQFAALRRGARSEYFGVAPVLLEHIRRLPGHPHTRLRCSG